MFYEEAGDGLPLVVLHGSGLDHRSCLPILEPIITAHPGFRRIYPDLPGHGQTSAVQSIRAHDDMLAVVLELMDALAPGQRFAIAGFSYGALLARGAAHQAAERIAGLLLAVSPVQGSQLPAFRVRHSDEGFTHLLGPSEGDKLNWVVWQTPDVLESIRETVDVGFPLADKDFFDRLDGPRFSRFDVDTLPNPFEAPSLIVAGRFDHWCGYDGMYGLLDDYPLSTYAVMDGGGHGAYLERPDLFRALVLDWLERVAVHEGHNPATG